MDGLLIVNKEKGYTSRDIVNIVSKKLNTKKMGHTGTLDPLATGVLVLSIGKATTFVEIVTCLEKEYIASITLGMQTDTFDIDGNVLREENAIFSKKEIEEVLKSFIGEYIQEVPIYSAVKVGGKKLYEYARNNEKVVLPKRKVNIYSLELLEYEIVNNKTTFKIKTKVSKGTYIRSLVNDIAHKLGTIGIMTGLERTKQGNFYIEDSYSLEEIKNDNYKIIGISKILDKYPKVEVDSYLEKKIKNGNILENRYDILPILFINKNNIPLALYKEYEKDKTKIKPFKML